MIDIICSDRHHPSYPELTRWAGSHGAGLLSDQEDAMGGKMLFLVSCLEKISKETRSRYESVLVLHESDLPQGRGWSPLAWQILSGKNDITVTLLEASEIIDGGRIWAQETVSFRGDELNDEINAKALEAKFRLMEMAIAGECSIRDQVGEPSYYRRRTPEDSRVDPNKTIAEQFDLLRICEPRFPAFLEFRGHIYNLTIKRIANVV